MVGIYIYLHKLALQNMKKINLIGCGAARRQEGPVAPLAKPQGGIIHQLLKIIEFPPPRTAWHPGAMPGSHPASDTCQLWHCGLTN